MAGGNKGRGRQWKPGESGNPKGRPKGSLNKDKSILADLARKYLDEPQEIELGKGKNKRTVLLDRKRMFIRAVFQAAIKGSVPAQQLLMNYIEKG